MSSKARSAPDSIGCSSQCTYKEHCCSRNPTVSKSLCLHKGCASRVEHRRPGERGGEWLSCRGAGGYGHQCFPREPGGRLPCTPGTSVDRSDPAALTAAGSAGSPVGRRAEWLALLLQRLGGYPVLLLDRCAGGGFLEPRHTEGRAGFWRICGL